jgi:hypothetical protein
MDDAVDKAIPVFCTLGWRRYGAVDALRTAGATRDKENRPVASSVVACRRCGDDGFALIFC